jgi:hypothetical protein
MNTIKKPKNKLVIAGLVLGTLGVAGLSYWYFTKEDKKTEDDKAPVIPPIDTPTNTPPPKNTSPTIKGLPLRKGSKGELVTRLQTELIQKFGSNILPKFGADGFFGNELEQALVNNGFSKIVDLKTYNAILTLNKPTSLLPPFSNPTNNQPTQQVNTNQASTLSAFDALNLANSFYKNLLAKNALNVMADFKQLKNVSDYVLVNTYFKTMRLRSVRQTLVTAALNTFPESPIKNTIKADLTRIGLIFDGKQWQLSGFNSFMTQRRVMTKSPVTVRNFNKSALEVPEGTLLGIELETLNGITTVQTLDYDLLTVPTQSIQYV